MATEATQLAESHSVTLPRWESFLGKLVALEKLVQCGRAHLRGIQSLLLLELRAGRTFRCFSRVTSLPRNDSNRGSVTDCDAASSVASVVTVTHLDGGGRTEADLKFHSTPKCIN